MGFQPHHYKSLDGAQIHLINGVQYLAGVAEATGDPVHAELEARARQLCLDIGVAHRAAEAAWIRLHQSDPATFYAALRGIVRWPDEPLVEVVPPCTCHDQCLFHTQGAPWASEADCNCDALCPRHHIVTEAEYAAPLAGPAVVDRLP